MPALNAAVLDSDVELGSKHLNAPKIKWFRRRLKVWARQNFRDFPWRHTCDPYAILVAEFLLQKTTAATVAPIYQAFVGRYPTISDLAAAPAAEVASLLQPLGLFFRAQKLQESARVIREKYRENVPRTEAELLELPGVGKYIARSVCANAFGQPKAVLDTNVARILQRFFGIDGGKVKSRSPELWQAAERVAPKQQVGYWNLGLLDFGAAVCTAKNPRCSECPLQQQCEYKISSEINARLIS
ncbi:A/G-specific adenine glycosylase [Tychonema sp. LEGE 07199]|uniref:A/G-specific adenine glycosylase n=1 Tax=unclassified Tychonema TaxID=2642144 RepID=UPI001882404A|nr:MULTISPECIES: A/G-specific adenine glycosylase [unclassified Tychonema]MBE9122332.1 A/G-specific adenine glycosylase [Tychonema sp. LEGE 07199]MBE9133554.1 A/G-specific adenine glycosylase [Tychonema sp. LEGE 07196]